MRPVVDCLLTLRAHVMPSLGDSPQVSKSGGFSPPHSPRSYLSVAVTGEEMRRALKEPKIHHASHSSPIITGMCMIIPFMNVREMSCFELILLPTDTATTINYHPGRKMYEAFQAKQGGYADIPSPKSSNRSKSNGLDVSS